VLNGAGVESMQRKWEEMFGEKKEAVVDEVKVKKPRMKAGVKKTVEKDVKSTSKKTQSNAKEIGSQKGCREKVVPRR
jgi:hypothetical protein